MARIKHMKWRQSGQYFADPNFKIIILNQNCHICIKILLIIEICLHICSWQYSSPSPVHYSEGIISVMASQITSLTIVYSIIYRGADQRKHQSSASRPLWGNSPVTGEFPAQRASNTENVSIWWCHHVMAWKRTDNKPLPEPMMVCNTQVWVCRFAETN